MKLFIVARNSTLILPYKKEILKYGIEYSKINPTIVLSLGGDGTYFIAEQQFPNIPKLIIKDQKINNEFSPVLFENILKQLKEGKYKIEEFIKLECNFLKHTLIAANDIVIRNNDQRQAIRFRISVDNIPLRHEHIGDGVVIATPFGSTGYFYSITKRTFKKGLGIALNNTNTERTDTIIKENSKVEIIITRGDATLSADNYKKSISLKQGDKVLIKRYKKDAKIVFLKK